MHFHQLFLTCMWQQLEGLKYIDDRSQPVYWSYILLIHIATVEVNEKAEGGRGGGEEGENKEEFPLVLNEYFISFGLKRE